MTNYVGVDEIGGSRWLFLTHAYDILFISELRDRLDTPAGPSCGDLAVRTARAADDAVLGRAGSRTLRPLRSLEGSPRGRRHTND